MWCSHVFILQVTQRSPESESIRFGDSLFESIELVSHLMSRVFLFFPQTQRVLAIVSGPRCVDRMLLLIEAPLMFPVIGLCVCNVTKQEPPARFTAA